MRKTRSAIVVTFAAALGSVTSAGCGGSTDTNAAPASSTASGAESDTGGSTTSGAPAADAPPPPMPPTMNPPAPTPPCPPLDAMREGDACSIEGQICYPREGCGPNGFTCRSGAWDRDVTFCNPPRR